MPNTVRRSGALDAHTATEPSCHPSDCDRGGRLTGPPCSLQSEGFHGQCFGGHGRLPEGKDWEPTVCWLLPQLVTSHQTNPKQQTTLSSSAFILPFT
jgi:hypothetical protein